MKVEIIQLIASSFFLLIVVGIPLAGWFKKVDLFQTFIGGAKEGVEVTFTILPYLIGFLVAIGMLKASGAFASLGHILAPLLSKIGMPADVLPLAFVRPFSGSAATGVMANIIQTHGGDAFISKLAATMMGSTETTFYVIGVYFGAVSITKTRHAIPAGLLAEMVGIFAALFVCQWLFL